MDDPDINPEELDIMLNPKHEELDVTKEEIIPIPFDLAMQFASEVYADADTDEEMKENILKFFPTLSGESPDPEVKLQKKIYLSEKACWYLDLMLEETKDTNSSFIEKLIIKEFKRKHAEGVFQWIHFLMKRIRKIKTTVNDLYKTAHPSFAAGNGHHQDRAA